MPALADLVRRVPRALAPRSLRSLFARALLAYTAFCALAVAVGVRFHRAVESRLEDSLAGATVRLEEAMEGLEHAKDLAFHTAQVQQWLTDYALTRGAPGLDSGLAEAERHAEGFRTALAAHEARPVLAASGVDLREVGERFEAFVARGEEMVRAYLEGGTARGNRDMLAFDRAADELASVSEPLVLACEREARRARLALAADLDAGLASVHRLWLALAGVLGTILVGLLVQWVVLSRGVFRPATALAGAIEHLREGDLEGRVEAPGRHEFARMAAAWNEALGSLSRVLGTTRVDWSRLARQREQERELAHLVELIDRTGEGLLRLDAEGRLVHANRAGRELLAAALGDGAGSDGDTEGAWARFAARHPSLLEDCGRAEIEIEGRMWRIETRELAGTASSGGERLVRMVDVTLERHRERAERARDEERRERERREAEAERERREARRQERIARELTECAETILAVLDAARAGDLERRSACAGEGPMERVAGGVDELLDALRTQVDAIVAATEELGSASGDLDRVSGVLAQVSNEGADEAAALSVAVTQASAGLGVASRHMARLLEEFERICERTVRADESAGNSLAAAERAHETVEELRARGGGIGEVTELILEIASQTQLLALNASIEAARAGGEGAGFRVIAEEVQELSQETARASRVIEGHVEAIRDDTERVHRSIEEVSGGFEAVHRLNREIRSAVEELAGAAGEVARAVEESEAGLASLGGASSHLAETSRDVDRAAREVAATAVLVAEALVALERSLGTHLSRALARGSTPQGAGAA